MSQSTSVYDKTINMKYKLKHSLIGTSENSYIYFNGHCFFPYFFFILRKQMSKLIFLLSSKNWIFCLVKKSFVKKCFTESETHRTKRAKPVFQGRKYLINKEKNRDCMAESFWVGEDVEVLGVLLREGMDSPHPSPHTVLHAFLPLTVP